MNEWIDELRSLSRSGERAIAVTISGVRGSAPRNIGAKMLVGKSETFGTIGGGELEYQCTRVACDLLRSDVNKTHLFRRFPLGSDPNIDVASVGGAYGQFRLVDANEQVFQLTASVITRTGSGSQALSGLQLFDCAAFSAPTGVSLDSTGISTYSVNSGVLDIPSTIFQGEQFSVRMEFIEGTSPPLFELLNFSAVTAGPSDAVLSDLARCR